MTSHHPIAPNRPEQPEIGNGVLVDFCLRWHSQREALRNGPDAMKAAVVRLRRQHRLDAERANSAGLAYLALTGALPPEAALTPEEARARIDQLIEPGGARP